MRHVELQEMKSHCPKTLLIVSFLLSIDNNATSSSIKENALQTYPPTRENSRRGPVQDSYSRLSFEHNSHKNTHNFTYLFTYPFKVLESDTASIHKSSSGKRSRKDSSSNILNRKNCYSIYNNYSCFINSSLNKSKSFAQSSLNGQFRSQKFLKSSSSQTQSIASISRRSIAVGPLKPQTRDFANRTALRLTSGVVRENKTSNYKEKHEEAAVTEVDNDYDYTPVKNIVDENPSIDIGKY